MGLFDYFRRREADAPVERQVDTSLVVAAVEPTPQDSLQTFSNTNITFQGDLDGYDYRTILRDKQKNITQLFELSDYFIDADPIYKGTIKHVYVPFSLYPKWKLTGTDDKTRARYNAYYDAVQLDKKLRSFFLQYYKYANVFVYVMEDGNIISLPVTKCKIRNVMLNGEPLVEFNIEDIRSQFGYSGNGSDAQKFFDDSKLEKVLKGYPKEVADGLRNGKTTVILNPENTFVPQDVKEDWQRYAIPMVASFLPPLAKKALIAKYEDAILNLGLRSFIHVKYGDPKSGADMLPNLTQLRSVRKIFSLAMSGNPLAVTNAYATAQVIQPETKFLYEQDKYREVNNALLSAGGISGIVVTGVSEDGSSFATAQVSMQTAAARIEQALSVFANMMTSINKLVYQRVTGKKSGTPPKFVYMPLDMAGKKSLQQACEKLWADGVLSSRSLTEAYGFDLDEEVSRRKKEYQDGTDDILMRREFRRDGLLEDKDNPEAKRGRPAKRDEERTSDPSKSQTGKQPKPSSENGSLNDADPLNTE